MTRETEKLIASWPKWKRDYKLTKYSPVRVKMTNETRKVSMTSMEFPTVILTGLIEYLQNHEEDIAIGINDFDDLRNLFLLLTGRWPEEG